MKHLHYDNGKNYDLIDVAIDYKLNFFRFNVLKYIIRAGKKDNEIQDLEKAKDYLNREIEFLRNKQKKYIENLRNVERRVNR